MEWPTPKKQAFTLLELLVAFSVVMTIFSLGLAAWGKFRRQSEIEKAARQIASQLRYWQAQAALGEKPQNCQDFTGYQVQVADFRLRVFACCGGACQLSVDQLVIDSRLNPVFSGFPFTFYSLSGRASQAAAITLSYFEEQRQVLVNKDGQISWQ